jgi:hypothetical protein
MNPLRHDLVLDIGGTKIATGLVGAARWAVERSVATCERLHQTSAPHLALLPCDLPFKSA